MPPDDARGTARNEALRWLSLAAKDLHVASLVVRAEPSAPVFHSQQCAEKSVKAFLALRNVYFRRTHGLEELGRQCIALEPTLEPLLTEAACLTDYATVFRYPDAPHEPDETEAAGALEIARRLHHRVIGLLGVD